MRECLSAGELPQRRNEVVEYTLFVQLLAAAGVPLKEPRVRGLCKRVPWTRRRRPGQAAQFLKRPDRGITVQSHPMQLDA
jgi:hypothetical protein